MKSDQSDIAARAWEKGVRTNERMGPSFQVQYPEFLPELKDWIKRDPVGAYSYVKKVSGAADFNQSKVGLQQGQKGSAKERANKHQKYYKVLVDLAQFYDLIDPEKPNFTDAARRLKGRVIPLEIEKNANEPTRHIEALEHLADLSVGRLRDILLEHENSLLSSP